jgi:hypothetical protein
MHGYRPLKRPFCSPAIIVRFVKVFVKHNCVCTVFVMNHPAAGHQRPHNAIDSRFRNFGATMDLLNVQSGRVICKELKDLHALDEDRHDVFTIQIRLQFSSPVCSAVSNGGSNCWDLLLNSCGHHFPQVLLSVLPILRIFHAWVLTVGQSRRLAAPIGPNRCWNESPNCTAAIGPGALGKLESPS